MQLPDHIGPGDIEQLVAAFERCASEVIGGEPRELQVGAGGAIEDDHAAGQGVEIGRHEYDSLQQGSSVGLTGISWLSLETPESAESRSPTATHRSRHWHRACAGCRGITGPDPSTALDERFATLRIADTFRHGQQPNPGPPVPPWSTRVFHNRPGAGMSELSVSRQVSVSARSALGADHRPRTVSRT